MAKKAEDYIKSADKDLKEIRKLGAKPEQRWFGIGPKKGPLSENDRMRKQILSDRELRSRAKGMKMKREANQSSAGERKSGHARYKSRKITRPVSR